MSVGNNKSKVCSLGLIINLFGEVSMKQVQYLVYFNFVKQLQVNCKHLIISETNAHSYVLTSYNSEI